MIGFLAPATVNGLAFLASVAVPVAAGSGAPVSPFLAPATINGLPYLAPPTVPGLVEPPDAIASVAGVVGGRGAHRATSAPASIKSSPAPAASRYHGASYEQEELAAAAELDDEETVIALLMEIALHV